MKNSPINRFGSEVSKEFTKTGEVLLEEAQNLALTLLFFGLLGLPHSETSSQPTTEHMKAAQKSNLSPEDMALQEQKDEEEKAAKIKAIRRMIDEEKMIDEQRKKDLENWQKRTDEELKEKDTEEQQDTPPMDLNALGSKPKPGALFARKGTRENTKKQGM